MCTQQWCIGPWSKQKPTQSTSALKVIHSGIPVQVSQLTCERPSRRDRLGLLGSAGLPGEAVPAPDVLWDGHASEPGDSIDLQHMPVSQPWPAHTCGHVHVDVYASMRLRNFCHLVPFQPSRGRRLGYAEIAARHQRSLRDTAREAMQR